MSRLFSVALALGALILTGVGAADEQRRELPGPLPERELLRAWAMSRGSRASGPATIQPDKVVARGVSDGTLPNFCGFFNQGRYAYAVWNSKMNVLDYPGFRLRDDYPVMFDGWAATFAASPAHATALLGFPKDNPFAMQLFRLAPNQANFEELRGQEVSQSSRMAFSTNGARVAIVRGTQIHLLDYPALTPDRRLDLPALTGKGTVAPAFSPNGRWVVAGIGDYEFDPMNQFKPEKPIARVAFYNLATGRSRSITLPNVQFTGMVSPVFSGDSRYVALAYFDSIRIFDVHTQTLVATFPTVDARVAAGGKERVRLALLFQGDKKIVTGVSMVSAMAFSPSGDTLVWATHNGTLNVTRWAAPRLAIALHAPVTYVGPSALGPTSCLAFSPDGETLLLGTQQAVLAFPARSLEQVKAPHRRVAPAGRIADAYAALSGANASDVMASLVQSGNEALAELEGVVLGYRVAPPNMTQVNADILGLNSDVYRTRALADHRLQQALASLVPHEAEGPVRAALHAVNVPGGARSLEQAQRAETLLTRNIFQVGLESRPAELTRAIRAIEVIEGIGSGYAAESLERIAATSQSAAVEQAATEAYTRLSSRLPRATGGTGLWHRNRLDLVP